jgi:LruC domain-containing protein
LKIFVLKFGNEKLDTLYLYHNSILKNFIKVYLSLCIVLQLYLLKIMTTLNRTLRNSIFGLLASTLVLTSCQKEQIAETLGQDNTTYVNASFSTTSNVSFNIKALDQENKAIALSDIKVYINEIKPENQILHGGIDNRGVFQALKMLPTATVELVGKVIIDPNFIGLYAVEVPINKATLSVDYTFTFDKGSISNGRVEETEGACNYTTLNSSIYTGQTYSVPQADANGKPLACDLFSQRPLNADFMGTASTLLQLSKDNADNKALAASSTQFPALSVTQNAEVWVTFLGEVAGYRNSLGYYIYDESEHASLTVNKIKDRAIIFNNTSLPNSGGNLPAGFTYKIPGIIPSGKRIGFFIIANAWNNGVSDNGKAVYYSDRRFNPESTDAKRQHTILLADRAADGKPKGVLLAFEDLPRETENGLNKDFNDVIFYITANPAECIVPNTMTDVKTEIDNCKECNEPKIYQDLTCGVLLFEDLWPKKGDFDMNDMVVNYKFLKFKDRNNKITKLQADFDLKAIGATYKNGFGFEMINFPASKINKVTGSLLTRGYISVDGKGLETDQANPTIIAFDNAFDLVKGSATGFINTLAADKSPKPRVEFNTSTINIEFVTGALPNDYELGAVPFNPFIIADGVRSREVHLSDGKATAKAKAGWNANYFNGADVTSVEPYKTNDGSMPFGLHLPIAVGATFRHPIERTSIEKAYPDFKNWSMNPNNPAYILWYNNAVSNLVFE